MKPKKRIAKVLKLIAKYGSTGEAYHKQWVLDQIVRILTDCPAVEMLALGVNNKPYTYKALGSSSVYLQWTADYRSGEDGPETYDWDIGIAP